MFSSPVHETGKEEEEEPADEMLADLGKPRLGEITRITCHIRESMEFKVSRRGYTSQHAVQGQIYVYHIFI